ncbi:MAG: shikimate dehydrogenase [Actinomycetes bacterium]
MAEAVPRRAAVLGHPIAHSLSPTLHRAAYRWLGLEWSYQAIDVETGGLAAFLDGLDDSWVGLSLTMPLKETVLDLLDDVEPLALAVRSVNTVLFVRGGRAGRNTDVAGLVAVLHEHKTGVARSATVLGSGATARSALAALVALGVPTISVCARHPNQARDLPDLAVDLAAGHGEASQPHVEVLPWDALERLLDVDVVVSTVPAGVTDALAGRLPGAALGERPAPGLLVDVVYDPWPTDLALAWRAAGGAVAGGLDMLVHQAHEQIRLMTGRDVPVSVLREAGESELGRRLHADGGRSRGAAGRPKQ